MGCPVAPLAMEAVRHIRALDRVDAKDGRGYDTAIRRICALEDAAAILQPRSRAGRFYLACVAYGCAEAVHSWIDDENAASRAMQARLKAEGVAVALAKASFVPELIDLTGYYFGSEIAAGIVT
ncbi:MAG: hypothetical protein KJ728_11910 [Alphaproteobacteria bacterium]|nr:hypothetical protein [Alphaproteobacteria bacterium]